MARFLVTRAMPEAEETAAQIIASGHEAIVAPLRRVEAVLAPVPDRPDVLVATSANAFRYGTPIPADWHDLPVFCVGERTAEAARGLGFTCVEAAQADVEALIARMGSRISLNENMLYLAGEQRRPNLEGWFLSRSRPLTLWPRYRMVDADELPANTKTAFQAHACDAVLHFSAESAAILIRLAKIAGLASALAQPLHVCLSETIVERVKAEIGTARIIVSEQKDATSLLEAAISAFT